MSGRVKWGVIVGLVGMVANLVVSFVMGICGPLVTLLAGAIAGFLAARSEGPGPRVRSAQAGAVAGLLAGGLMLISQVVAGVAVVLFLQATGLPGLGGTIPANPTVAAQASFLVGALATGGCFGIIGLVLAALAGAAAGYLGGSGETA
jgi:hypothetical protein